MSSINPSPQGQIKDLDTALSQCIKQAESGKTNEKNLSAIQQQLKALINNPNVPDGIKKSLQDAANEIKQLQSGGGSIGNLYSAKQQVDAALSSEQGEEKSGGGSLGGGGSEEQ